ncbi:50S ribosomal protein L1 [Thermoflexus sp.]|uniref:50S ribosomal protein L1 n=1 Tax=Thermoflexus sp. TaxID=1969742 RepID=UPI0025CF3BF8|nr:50S ribosomal protein L1 [Thermoflexus sp.]MDW8179873.1 50S ribosomal protein L1 [Anaerolineae bacterium]MCS6964127.1 50S ribosomal protein L1 [Thermoflexus sp.]MCS7350422.1 50S ribosomal protein L1 [Thermoflexus sp.]MCX7689968.1 50S ribosomal protein L1 [Thermoflexus sp.]MDW8185773.1 50S ribosomal protein L1 [Anaerolineae bacterium]
MGKRGKKYLEALKKVDRERLYSPREALELVKETSYTRFDGTVEVHMRLGVDPRHADQQVRGVVVLPHGLGKQVRVLVFAAGEAARIAQEAGADYIISDDEGIKRIQEGWTDFDVAIATPDMMPKVGRLGRILGPRGLMPNPRAGTVVNPEDLPRAIREAKAGRVEFRVDKTANLHVPIGKISFSVDQLLENFAALMDAVKKARPSGLKGTYIRKVVVSATMGPGIKVDPAAAQSLELTA